MIFLQAVQKLGMKPVPGIMRVTVKKSHLEARNHEGSNMASNLVSSFRQTMVNVAALHLYIYFAIERLAQPDYHHADDVLQVSKRGQ